MKKAILIIFGVWFISISSQAQTENFSIGISTETNKQNNIVTAPQGDTQPIEGTVYEVCRQKEGGVFEETFAIILDSPNPGIVDGEIIDLEGVSEDFKQKYHNEMKSIQRKLKAKAGSNGWDENSVRRKLNPRVRLTNGNITSSKSKIQFTDVSNWSFISIDYDAVISRELAVQKASGTGESIVLVIQVTANDSEPTITPANMSDHVFGTHGESLSNASQFAAISYNQKTLSPAEGPHVVDGVLQVAIDQNVIGVDGGAGPWRNAVIAAANAKLGFSLTSQFDLVMIVCPPGMTGGWQGYAYPNHWMSVYKHSKIDNINVTMHEIGHNLGLAHSGEAGFEYGDNTGYMGSATTTYSAFNGAKGSQLGWYSDREYVISQVLPDSWIGNLVGVVDYAKASGDEQVLLKVKGATADIHVAFNRKKGFNSNTKESANKITVTKRGSNPGYSQSWLLAKLDLEDSVYVVNDFGGINNDLYIEVHDIVYGSPVDYATVSINFTAGYPGNVQFSTQTFYANESQGTVSVAVQRSAGSLGAVSVEYALSTGSSATLGSDFNFSPGTLYWADGEDGLKTFDIDILQDGNIEEDETINLVLQNVTGASLNSLVEATVTLEDDDLNEVEVSISTGSDDVEERQDGTLDMSSSDLEMVFDGFDQVIGLRFNNINVPQSANILNAYIQFTVDEVTSNETNLIIHGENIGDAQTFNSQNVSSRSTTSNIVNWSVPVWSPIGSSGEDQRTPDLSSIVTEIVNLQDWILGNSMVFKITGSGKRVAESYEGAQTSCAKLHIEYNNYCSVAGTDLQTACDSLVWIDGNTYYTSNNIATFNILGGAANTCDSLVTLDLTIITVNSSVTQVGGLLTADESGAVYQWLNCPAMSPISGAISQSYNATANGEYAVIVTNNGCSDTSSCHTVIEVGIIENDFRDKLLLHPNPTSGNFSIDLGSMQESVSISITDITGRLVHSKTFKNSQLLNLKLAEPKGVYIIIIESGDQNSVIRLVKE